MFGKDRVDIVLADFGREWEVHRKVAHSAVRKFAVNDRLAVIVNKKVKTLLEEIKEKNGDNSFDPTDYLSYLMMFLLGTSAFSEEFKIPISKFCMMHSKFRVKIEIIYF